MMDSKPYDTEWEIEQIEKAIEYFKRGEYAEDKIEELLEKKEILLSCLEMERMDRVDNIFAGGVKHGKAY